MHVLRTAMIVLATVSTSATLGMSQERPPGLLAKSILLEVKTDRFPQFEEALRQRLAYHRANHDGWSWHVWQIVNGDNLGDYYLRTHGHRWEDFDAESDLRRSDWADFLANIAPNLESMSSTISSLEPALSSWPASVTRPPLVSLTRFELNYQGFREFRAALEKIHAAMSDKAADRHYAWASTINGSDGPEMTLLVPLASWTDLEPRQPTLWSVIEEVYGAEQANALRATIGSSVRAVHSSVVAYREDLSYEPVSP